MIWGQLSAKVSKRHETRPRFATDFKKWNLLFYIYTHKSLVFFEFYRKYYTHINPNVEIIQTYFGVKQFLFLLPLHKNIYVVLINIKLYSMINLEKKKWKKKKQERGEKKWKEFIVHNILEQDSIIQTEGSSG